MVLGVVLADEWFSLVWSCGLTFSVGFLLLEAILSGLINSYEYSFW